MSLKIRNSLEREDWRFIREVCARTGNAGEPIEPSRWPFFGEQWVGPYEKLRPEWSYIAEDQSENGASRMGYLNGCPDTARFQFEKRWLFNFPLYFRARAGLFVANGDRDRFITRFSAGGGPEDCFSRDSTAEVLSEFPAHLHTNLEVAARGKGVGRALIDRYREDLAAEGVYGIHLYCGPRPLPFYEQVGFRRLDQIEFRPGIIVYRLGSRF